LDKELLGSELFALDKCFVPTLYLDQFHSEVGVNLTIRGSPIDNWKCGGNDKFPGLLIGLSKLGRLGLIVGVGREESFQIDRSSGFFAR